MKPPLELLKEVSEYEKHRMASIPFHGDLALVLDAMEEYAAIKVKEALEEKEDEDRNFQLIKKPLPNKPTK